MLINWSQVEGASYYEIEIEGKNQFYQTHDVTPKNLEEHSYMATGLKHNAEHIITITAHNKFTDGSKTSETFFTRPYTPPNFRGIEIYDDTVTLGWDAVEARCSKYITYHVFKRSVFSD